MSDVLVLCYHAVSKRWPARLSIGPELLDRHLAILRRHGYVGATFARAVIDPPAPRTVAITFDDGYRSVLRAAAPILATHGFPGSVYVPTAWVGADRAMRWAGIDGWLGGPHESELEPLGWDELAHLRSIGWEVGSHTRTHPQLTTLGAVELRDELECSRAEIEVRLGGPCRTLAYPYGDVDERVVAAARRAGYTAAAALPREPGAPDRLCWPRVGIYRHDEPWRFALKRSRLVRRLRTRHGAAK